MANSLAKQLLEKAKRTAERFELPFQIIDGQFVVADPKFAKHHDGWFPSAYGKGSQRPATDSELALWRALSEIPEPGKHQDNEQLARQITDQIEVGLPFTLLQNKQTNEFSIKIPEHTLHIDWVSGYIAVYIPSERQRWNTHELVRNTVAKYLSLEYDTDALYSADQIRVPLELVPQQVIDAHKQSLNRFDSVANVVRKEQDHWILSWPPASDPILSVILLSDLTEYAKKGRIIFLKR